MSAIINSEELRSITGDWKYSALPSNIIVGEGCFLERKESFARFRSDRNPGLVLGNRVTVYTWTDFNTEPTGQIEIGDDSILVGAVFMCADKIVIGQRVVISYNVTIADSDFHPRDPDLRRQDAIANAPYGDRTHRPALITAPVEIGNDVCIGIGAVVLKGVRIGDGAKIWAGAVVTRDVPPNALVAGNPAQVVAEDS